MKIDNLSFQVIWESYCEKNFCTDFLRKYHQKPWDMTKKSIEDALSRIHNLQDTQLLDSIRSNDGYGIFKFDFRIACSKESAKTSGNRIILFVDNHKHLVKILLVYGKNHLPKKQGETIWWKNIIQKEFENLWNLI